ncbi:MAG: hypothetical protein ACREF7_01390, partial [Candidatus Saccharimonadales bacterium]
GQALIASSTSAASWSTPTSKGRSATLTIAASNSSTISKNSADYVCAGTSDEDTINTAINALPANGGRVVLLEGDFNCTNSVIIDSSYVSLEGQGLGFATSITCPDGGVSRSAAIIVGDTKIVYQCSLRDFAINAGGGTQNVQSGTGHGIVLAGEGCFMENVIVQFPAGDAFHIGQDLLNPSVQTRISTGGSLPQTTINVNSTAGFASSGAIIINTSAGPAYITYTSKTGTSFTGLSCNFPTGASLSSGQTVIQATAVFETTLINCDADNPGQNGYYMDWNYSSCELFACRADGSNSGKPSSVGTSCGFVLYGTQVKLVVCHAYFFNQYGLSIGGSSTYTAGEITILGGEWETNASAGVCIENNNGAVLLNGLQ